MHVRDELRNTMLSLSLNVPCVLFRFTVTTSDTARLERLCDDCTVWLKMESVVK